MNLPPERKGKSQIVIGLTAMSNNDSAIATGVALAASVGSSVKGLFIEDEALHDLAGLPFAVAQDFGPSPPQRITPQKLSMAFKQRSMICRQALAEMAEQSKLPWSFSVRRGNWPDIDEDTDDVIVLARETRGRDLDHLLQQLRRGETVARSIVVSADKSAFAGPVSVVAIIGKDEGTNQSLRWATRLAAKTRSVLHLLVVDDDDSARQQAEAKARSLIDKNQEVAFHRVKEGALHELIASLDALNPLFVATALSGSLFADDDIAKALLRTVRSALLLSAGDDGPSVRKR